MKILKKGGLVFVIGAASILFIIYNPGESGMYPPCPFYSITGLYCPGCGSQRAAHSLLHLDFSAVMHYNILFLPVIPALGYHYLQLLLNRKFHLNLPNLFYSKLTPWLILGIIILFWVTRNLSFYPFLTLAPGITEIP